MNLNIAVVGAAKVGKTLFCINFAEYLGAKNLNYTETGPHGKGRGVILPRTARELMVDPGSRCKGVVRTFAVHLLQRPSRRVALIDTASLKENAPLPKAERTKLLLTLQAIQQADAVLHLVDLSCGDPARAEFALAINHRMERYCSQKGIPYLAVGNKRDLLHGSPFNYRQFFSPNGKMPAVSSATGEGFPKIRRLLLERTA